MVSWRTALREATFKQDVEKVDRIMEWWTRAHNSERAREYVLDGMTVDAWGKLVPGVPRLLTTPIGEYFDALATLEGPPW